MNHALPRPGHLLRKNIEGLAIGTIVTIAVNLFVALVLVPADQDVSIYTALSVITFGISVGWTIHISDIGLPAVLRGIVLFLLLGIAWRFEIFGNQGQPGFYVSIAIEAVSGALMGLLSDWLVKRRSGGLNTAP